MATVSNPPSLSSVVSVFGGPGNLTAYYRGGPYVPNIPQNANIATSATSLALSQFAGATNYTNVTASASPTTMSGSASGTSGSTIVVSTAAMSPGAVGSGGTGSYTYSWTKTSGGLISANTATSSGPRFYGSVKVNAVNPNTVTATFVCTVSDGTTSANTGTVTVNLTATSTT